MFTRDTKVLIICVIISLFCVERLYADTGDKRDVKRLRINWERDESAAGYKVQIRNTLDKLVLNKEVESNYIDFILSPGKYRIRVGAVNKFNKIDVWSDWRYFEIARKAITKPMRGAFNIGLKIGVGMCYFQMLPEFDSYYANSYQSATVMVGYSLGKMALFTALRFLRFTGLELESSYVKFEGRDVQNRIKADNTHVITGGNIYMRTMFSFPLNLIIRGGGGIAYTKFEYYDIDGNGKSASFDSQDPFYRIGCALEFNLTRSLFFESGIDYYVITYIGDQVKALRYFGLIGMKL
jgi:hypothetical protein